MKRLHGASTADKPKRSCQNMTASDQQNAGEEKVAREYQVELFGFAKTKNTIVYLDTGSGKTFIAVMLLREYTHILTESDPNRRKWGFMLVPTAELVVQQCKALSSLTFHERIGRYRGVDGVDHWERERWTSELEKNCVLVMTYQIFLDMLTHGIISIENVCVLILDECHCSVGNHPSRGIMHEVGTTPIEKRPRVLGLTASLFSGKIKTTQVNKKLHELERNLFSSVKTSKNAAVADFSTKPDITHVYYEPNSGDQRVLASLQEADEEIRKIEAREKETGLDEDKRIERDVKRQRNDLRDVSTQLGTWACVKCANALDESNEKLLRRGDTNDNTKEALEIMKRSIDIISKSPVEELNHANIGTVVTSKVQKLLSILSKAHARSQNDAGGIKCLVFVETRMMARTLAYVLQCVVTISKHYEFIHANYVTGFSSIKEGSSNSARRLKDVMDDFRFRNLNVLVTTSVLAEGIDIPKCNVVIRFDPPKTYGDYKQSMGRARYKPAVFALLIPDRGIRRDELEKDFELFRRVNEMMPDILRDRCIESDDEEVEYMQRDEDVYRVPNSTAHLTKRVAINILSKYCATLNGGRYGIGPIWELVQKEETQGSGFQYILRLPPVSPVKNIVTSELLPNKRNAKNDAAFKMCILLHKAGELTEKLLPERESDDEDEPTKHVRGTQKFRNAYDRTVAWNLMDIEPVPGECFLQLVGLNGIEAAVEMPVRRGTIQAWAILTSRRLPRTPTFSLHHNSRDVDVNISDEPKQVKLSDAEFKKLKIVYDILVEKVWRLQTFIDKSTRKIVRDLNSGPVFVPVTCHKSDGQAQLVNIDWSAVDKALSVERRSHKGGAFEYNPLDYRNAVILPDHRSKEYFMCDGVEPNTSPNDPFPHSSEPGVRTYADYFSVRYHLKRPTVQQALVRCTRRVPSISKKLTPTATKMGKTQGLVYFIPELCKLIPVSAELWLEASCLPAVWYRLQQIHTANELRVQLNMFTDIENCDTEVLMASRDEKELFAGALTRLRSIHKSRSDINHWLDTLEQCHSGKPWREADEYYGPGLDRVMQALTHRSANDVHDLERLETVGDSLLKYVASVQVFCAFPKAKEGKLSRSRVKVISNKNLLGVALEQELPGRLINTAFDPHTNWLVPGYRPVDIQPVEDGKASVDNTPLGKQVIGDKRVSDCVEALIGCYLVHGSEQYALRLMRFLKLIPHLDSDDERQSRRISLSVPPTCLDRYEGRDLEQAQRHIDEVLYKKYDLGQVEQKLGYVFNDKAYLVEAFTHSTCTDNHITSSYERLEFLGDAVLDYVVTRILYDCPKNFNPGDLTDLRSALVNNFTLARITVKLELHLFVQVCSKKLYDLIKEYSERLQYAESHNDIEEQMSGADDVCKILGDVFESVLGAIYIDCGQDLSIIWSVLREPLIEKLRAFLFHVPKNPIRLVYEADSTAKFSNPEKIGGDLEITEMTLVCKGKTFKAVGRNRTAAKRKVASMAVKELNLNK